MKSGSVAGVMKTGAIMAKDAQDNAADKAEKASKARASDTLLLQLLSDIDARISELDDLIARYDEEIQSLDEQIEALDKLIEVYELEGDIDPNNPAHRALLIQAGIPADEWGLVEQNDYLYIQRGQLTQERDGIVDEKSEAEIERHGLENEKAMITAEYNAYLDEGYSPSAAISEATSGTTYASKLVIDEIDNAEVDVELGNNQDERINQNNSDSDLSTLNSMPSAFN